MSNNRDPIDKGIVWLGWQAAIAIIMFFFGWLIRRGDDEKNEAKRLQFSPSLEVDYTLGVSFVKPHKKVARWRLVGISLVVVYVVGRQLLGVGNFNPIEWLIVGGVATSLFFKWRKDQQIAEQETLFQQACQAPPLRLATAKKYSISVPKSTQWDTGVARRFMSNILEKLTGKLVFQIVAEAEGITWQILDLRQQYDPQIIMTTIKSFYPNAEIVVTDVSEKQFRQPYYRYTMPVGQQMPLGSLQTIEQLKNFDPLATLTAEVNSLQSGERVSYTLFVTEYALFLNDQIEDWLTDEQGVHPLQFLSHEGWFEAGQSVSGKEPERFERFTRDSSELIREKINNVCCQALLVLQVDAPIKQRVAELLLARSHLSQYDNVPHNALRWIEDDFAKAIEYVDNERTAQKVGVVNKFERWLTNQDMGWNKFRLILNVPELAAMWHLPHTGFSADKIAWAKEEIAPLPKELQDKAEGIQLGTAYASRVEYPVHMQTKDRATHMLITGAIGMGKSTLMHKLIQQDIACGHGVAVIDPKGNLIADILSTSIPDERLEDVVLWDLADTVHPPSLNFLLKSADTAREDTAATVMNVFEKQYGSDFAYTRMGQILVQGLQAVMGDKTPTLRDISRLFRDPEYQDTLLRQITNPVSEEFWMRFDNKSENARNQEVSPMLNKVEAIYGDRLLYPIFCQPNTLNIREWMEQKKIVLISLNPPSDYNLSRDKQSLLGSILMSEFQLAVATQDLPEPFYVYADEAHQLVTSSLDEIFIKARQRQLSMTLATQYPKQLAQAFDAVMETVGATIAFPCQEGTAKILQKRMKPEFTEHDLINLEPYSAAVRMRYDEKQMRPFLLHTDNVQVPAGEDVECRVQAIRENSRKTYFSMTNEEIHQWLAERYSSGRNNSSFGDFSEPI